MATRLRPSITDALDDFAASFLRKPNRTEAPGVIHRRRAEKQATVVRMHKLGPNRGAAYWTDRTYSLHGMSERQMDRFIEIAHDDPILYAVGAAAVRVRHVEELARLTRIENYLRGEAASGAYDPDFVDEPEGVTV